MKNEVGLVRLQRGPLAKLRNLQVKIWQREGVKVVEDSKSEGLDRIRHVLHEGHADTV